MPFLGRDWRSPGDNWMRCDQGWQLARAWRLQFLENLNDNIQFRIMQCPCNVGSIEGEENCWLPYDDSTIHLHQPHIVLPRRVTQERKALVCASEASSGLDFESAVRDTRKFKYVCKVLETLIVNKFGEMSGTTHNIVVKLLEIASQTVLKNETNLHVVDRLLKSYIDAGSSSMSKIGSNSRHQANVRLVSNLREAIHSFKPTERFVDGQATLTDLPEEMVRDILRRLTDHADLLHTGTTRSSLYSLVQEEILWKDLCYFHFSDAQRRQLLVRESLTVDEDDTWKSRYRKLVKRHGKKEVFAVTLHLCSYCNAIFWPSHGHPCAHILTEEEKEETIRPPKHVTPEMFIDLFFPKPYTLPRHW